MPHARPLSPHLGIYKWQITMVLSIVHRLTGLFLCLGALLVAWGLIALASSDSAWSAFTAFCASWIGIVLLILWTFSLFFHLCNGIRHLFWDAGAGFEKPTYHTSGWVVVIAAVALTLCVWIWMLAGAHGGAA
ncbi:MAG: succinate dehydrogenase, cytochrome b556 subunit [Rhodanobacteraceae bacterium]